MSGTTRLWGEYAGSSVPSGILVDCLVLGRHSLSTYLT